MSATIGYTDMTYGTDSPDRSKGDSLDLVAPWKYSASLDCRRPLAGNTTFVARADYQYTDSYLHTLRNFLPDEKVASTGPRSVVNVRIGADFGTFEAFLFADNLTDDNGHIYPIVATLREPVPAMPRSFGVQLGVNPISKKDGAAKPRACWTRSGFRLMRAQYPQPGTLLDIGCLYE